MEKKSKKLNRVTVFDVFNVSWMVLFSLYCLIPLFIIISASFSRGTDLLDYGYGLFPRHLSFKAYGYIFSEGSIGGELLLRSYINSIIVTGGGTAINLFLCAMIAFPLSKYDFDYKKWITPILLVTMLFSPGLVPTYILITQYLDWDDTIWVLMIPQIGTTFNIILLRTFFSDIPREIGESAKIDGCSVFREFLTITLPLSLPSLATCSVLIALSYWNDWGTSLLYIDKHNTNLYTVQYLMVQLQERIEATVQTDPIEYREAKPRMMALCVIGTLPILFVFLYLQKYIVQGMTVGAVKG